SSTLVAKGGPDAVQPQGVAGTLSASQPRCHWCRTHHADCGAKPRQRLVARRAEGRAAHLTADAAAREQKRQQRLDAAYHTGCPSPFPHRAAQRGNGEGDGETDGDGDGRMSGTGVIMGTAASLALPLK